MQVILMILGLALVMVLIFRGVPIFFTALIASLFIVVTTAILTTAQINLSQIMITEFVNGIAGYFGSYFWLFILGAIFGKLFEVSGAADSIATGIINKLGEKAIVPAIILAGFLLSYGGVSVFVAFFAMYPLMLSMFKKADITRHLLPHCLRRRNRDRMMPARRRPQHYPHSVSWGKNYSGLCPRNDSRRV